MQHINRTATLSEVQTTKSASHTRSSKLSLREGKELSYTSESTGGAERQACHTPKGSHSTARFHKAPSPFKRRSLSLFVQRYTFQTCGERMPNSETHESRHARGTRTGACCQLKHRFQPSLPKHKQQQVKLPCTKEFNVTTKVDKEAGIQK